MVVCFIIKVTVQHGRNPHISTIRALINTLRGRLFKTVPELIWTESKGCLNHVAMMISEVTYKEVVVHELKHTVNQHNSSCPCCCNSPSLPAEVTEGNKLLCGPLLPPSAGSAPCPWGSGLLVRGSFPSPQPGTAPAACRCRGRGPGRAVAVEGPRWLDAPKHCFYRPGREAGRPTRGRQNQMIKLNSAQSQIQQ